MPSLGVKTVSCEDGNERRCSNDVIASEHTSNHNESFETYLQAQFSILADALVKRHVVEIDAVSKQSRQSRFISGGSTDSIGEDVCNGDQLDGPSQCHADQPHQKMRDSSPERQDSSSEALTSLRPARKSQMPGGGARASVRASLADMASINRSSTSATDLSGRRKRYCLRDCWTDHASEVHGTRMSEFIRASASSTDTEAFVGKRGSDACDSRRRSGSATVMLTAWHCLTHLMAPLIIPPDGWRRWIWEVVSFCCLLYDGVVRPVEICFDLSSTPVASMMDLLLCSFWTLDIVLSFLTGVYIDGRLSMNPDTIAWAYMKFWFPIDFILVALDWMLLAMLSHSSKLRGVRLARLLRLLRLLRFLRLLKVRGVLHDILTMSSVEVNVTFAALKAVVCLVALVHWQSCLWHLAGDVAENGWARRNRMASQTVAERYAVSLQTMLGRLQGVSTGFEAVTHFDVVIDAVALFISLLSVSCFAGLISQALLLSNNSSASENVRLAQNFVKRHKISSSVRRRMIKYLSAYVEAGAGEMIGEGKKLLSALPLPLQEDLLAECRSPIVCALRCLKELRLSNPRVLRHLCHETMTDALAVCEEVVFDKGDACVRMFFVTAGEFRYKADEFLLQSTPRTTPRIFPPHLEEGCEVIRAGHYLCEASLWTKWEHIGALVASVDSVLLAINAEIFGKCISLHWAAYVHLTKYAQHFVWRLNRSSKSDVIGFDLPMEILDESVYKGNEENHFMFISHYKEEAGTEAALMRDALEALVKADPLHPANELQFPIFVDSENLDDLTELDNHVVGSQSIVLLLTPGLLSRPWCLLEIVTAINNQIPIVPVEVQRPGTHFPYPDEAFYQRFQKGLVLEPEGIQLLDGYGISLEDMIDAIRQVFQKIALPFSPHKSGTVRQAELMDIMRRSQLREAKSNLRRSMTASSFMSKASQSGLFGNVDELEPGLHSV